MHEFKRESDVELWYNSFFKESSSEASAGTFFPDYIRALHKKDTFFVGPKLLGNLYGQRKAIFGYCELFVAPNKWLGPPLNISESWAQPSHVDIRWAETLQWGSKVGHQIGR